MDSRRRGLKSIGIFAVFSLSVLTTSGSNTVFGQTSHPLFDFSSDIRIFTAYAMMNAAGSGGEWHKGAMYPIRSELRADLAARLDTNFRNRIREFNRSHGRILETYELALLTAGPPDFRLSYDPKTTGDLAESLQPDSGFVGLLAEFYKKADIPVLWAKYGPLIQAENDKYNQFADAAMEDVDSYCRLDTSYFYRASRTIHFQFMPLLPYFTSLTARVNGDIYIIVGPQQEKPDRSIFYYHLLTRVALPLVRSDSADVERLHGLFDEVKENIDMKRGNWNILVAECFAEAMDMRLEKKLYDLDSSQVHAALTAEYKFGFILSPTIYESLKKYEESGMTFAEYFPTILKGIDYRTESEKWKEFWSKQ